VKRDIFLRYWGAMLGLSATAMRSRTCTWSHRGRYVEKLGDKYIYYFHDPRSKKNILAASEKNLLRLQQEIANLEALRPHRLPLALKRRKLIFADVDLVLAKSLKKLRHDKEVRALTRADSAAIKKFLRSCSADDRDTLDFRPKNDKGFGLFHNGNLVGIARYIKIPSAPRIADITVLVHRRHRGKGLSSPLVYELCHALLKNKLIPKYRVGENNHASMAIAQRLGFKTAFYLYSFR